MGLPGHHWNSLHSRTKAKILLPASVAAWCQNVSCQRELQPNACISLCFSVRNRSDKTPLTPSSCCTVWVQHKQVKTPQRPSFRLFSGYMCALRPTASHAVCVVDTYISHRAHAGEPCAGKWPGSMLCPGAMGDRLLPISCGWWWWASPGL